MAKKSKEYNRIKSIKRASRVELGGIGGKAGIHSDKRERRVRRMSTQDWLDEAEEDTPVWMDAGPGEELPIDQENDIGDPDNEQRESD